MSFPSGADRVARAHTARAQRRERRRRGRQSRTLLALGFGLLVGLAMLAPWIAAPLERSGLDLLFVARHWAFGPLFEARESDVAIVAVDEETYHTPPFAERPRIAWSPQLASVIAAIDAAGPRVIGYDFVDPTSLDRSDLLPRFDRPLLAAMTNAGRAGRLVLGEIRLSREIISPYRGQRMAVGGDDHVRLLNLTLDPDDVVRRQALRFPDQDGGEARLGFAAELARRAGATLPDAPEILINFNTGPNDIPDYSFADIHACAVAGNTAFFREAFKDKVVLIAPGLDIEDRHFPAKWMIPVRPELERQTRCGAAADVERFGAIVDRSTIHGAFIHAAVINTLTKRLHLRALDPAIAALISAAAAIGAALIFAALPPLRGALAGAALIAGEAALALLVFRQGIVTPIVAAALATLLAFTVVYAFRFVVEERARRRVTHAFGHYLAPAMVERLAADPGALRLGGERRHVAVMFVDIAGYTAMSEALTERPEQLVEIINRYLTVVAGIVERHRGYVDKFIGDAVMAIWGAPLDDRRAERHAVETALDLQAAMVGFNRDVVVGEYGLAPIETRIGISSGIAIAGNMGGAGRVNYTVAGDVVNLAARLEAANKSYGSAVMLAGDTARALGPAYALRQIDRLIVKGKSLAVDVFELIGRSEDIDAATRARLERFDAARAAYLARDFAGAADAFAALADSDPVAALLAARARGYHAVPPPTEWDGSTALDTK